jgi:hypothetical protein
MRKTSVTTARGHWSASGMFKTYTFSHVDISSIGDALNRIMTCASSASMNSNKYVILILC